MKRNTQYHLGEYADCFRKLTAPLVTFAIVGSLLAGAVAGIDNLRTERVRRQVTLIADVDRNRVLTIKEWSGVYEEPGLPYIGKKGTDLSREQLREYISRHSK